MIVFSLPPPPPPPPGERSGDVRMAQLPYSPSLATPLLVDSVGREAKDKQRRERAREQLLKINQRKREEKARERLKCDSVTASVWGALC